MTDKLKLSLRIDFPGGGRFGPGKAALLTAIAETGSINGAATQLSMSYPKALKLIEQMNGDFDEPLVQSRHGGSERGGTQLTVLGAYVLERYQAIVAKAETGSAGTLAELSSRLSKSD